MSTRTQTVAIEWTEVSHHQATVNVAGGFDLGDALAALSGAGFTGVEREGITVRLVKHDAAAVSFDPI